MPKKTLRVYRKKTYSKKKAKTPDYIKRVAGAAIVVVLSLSFLSAYSFYKKLTAGYASAFSSSSHDLLTSEYYTLAYVGVDSFSKKTVKPEFIQLFVVDKGTKKMIVYNIPLDTQIDVPGIFGVEPFSNIFALGMLSESSDLNYSADLVSRSIFKLTAFPVDRYLLVENAAAEFTKSLLYGQLKISGDIDLNMLKYSIKTNLSLQEFYDFYNFANTLPSDRIIQKEYLDIYKNEPILLDEEFMDITFDTSFSNEKMSISILNGSAEPGLATFGSRVVSNLGGRVVAVGNTVKIQEKSKIIAESTSARSVYYLSSIFGIEDIIEKSELNEMYEGEISRSDITVILGLDFAKGM